MLASGVIGVFGLLALIAVKQAERSVTPLSYRVSQQLQKLWEITGASMRDSHYLRAEKALLTILRLDKRNAVAYNRLGILYSRQKEYKDAIECFEIASSIQPSASSLHNLGLIYYETENFQKASAAFEASLALEDNLAARHIAYAKVQEKMGNNLQMIHSLKTAVELEPSDQTLRLLMAAYQDQGFGDEAKAVEKRLKRSVKSKRTPRTIRRPKRVVY